jgi:hypothetical protein
MGSSRTILRDLRYINNYLSRFHKSLQSTYFEKLIAEAFSHVLHLPFYTISDDNKDTLYCIIWQGDISNSSITKAPQGEPDAVAYCYGFYLLIEATLKTGANQWSQEFAASIRHCENFCSKNNILPENVFALLVCTDLHKDTYRSIQHNPTEYKLIPIEIPNLSKIIETSILAFTIRHIELRRLLIKILETVRNSSSLDDFRNTVNDLVTDWQKDVLKIEKNALVGLKSYETMQRINRTYIGVSEILKELQKDRTIDKYFKIIGEKLSFDIIEESLIHQSLAFRLTSTYEGENLFSPVPFVDFNGRWSRFIKAVEELNG